MGELIHCVTNTLFWARDWDAENNFSSMHIHSEPWKNLGTEIRSPEGEIWSQNSIKFGPSILVSGWKLSENNEFSTFPKILKNTKTDKTYPNSNKNDKKCITCRFRFFLYLFSVMGCHIPRQTPSFGPTPSGVALSYMTEKGTLTEKFR